MTSLERPTTSSVLRLGTRGAWAMLALFLGTQIVLAVLNPLPGAVLDYIALVLTCAGAVVLAIPGDKLPLATTVVITAIPTAVAVLMSFALPATSNLGYGAWHFGADGFLMFFLALRNRPGWSWLGLAGIWIVTIIWAESSGLGAASGFFLVIREAGIQIIGTFFNLAFTRTSAQIAALQDAQTVRVQLDAETQAAIETRIAQSARLDASAQALLSRIASGVPLTDNERAECLLLEASLRDSVRARTLYEAPVIEQAHAARLRGVEVTLLDDSGYSNPAESLGQLLHGRLLSTVAAELRGAATGRFTARVVPPDRGFIATLMHESGGSTELFHVDVDGEVIR